MKNVLLGSTAMLLLAGLAQAEEVPMPANLADWSGAYAGVHAGWVHSGPDFDPGVAAPAATDYRFHDDGMAAGIFAGYDWRAGPWVYGVAADFDWLDIDVQSRASQQSFGKGDSFDYDLDWAASARVRGGHLFNDDRLLLYGTAGVAVTEVSASSAYRDAGTLVDRDRTAERTTGIVYGAGFEYAFAPNWTLRTEYLAYSFDRIGVGDLSGGSAEVEFQPRLEQVRFGIAYRF